MKDDENESDDDQTVKRIFREEDKGGILKWTSLSLSLSLYPRFSTSLHFNAKIVITRLLYVNDYCVTDGMKEA